MWGSIIRTCWSSISGMVKPWHLLKWCSIGVRCINRLTILPSLPKRVTIYICCPSVGIYSTSPLSSPKGLVLDHESCGNSVPEVSKHVGAQSGLGIPLGWGSGASLLCLEVVFEDLWVRAGHMPRENADIEKANQSFLMSSGVRF